MRRESKHLQRYLEIILSLCTSREAFLLAVDRSQRLFQYGDSTRLLQMEHRRAGRARDLLGETAPKPEVKVSVCQSYSILRANADCVGRYNALSQPVKQSSTNWKESPYREPKKSRPNGTFDPSKYTTRLIALKFAYLGQNYNGLEYHANNKTPLPTVEEELWTALNKAKLVLPTPTPPLEPGEPNWEGCEYSKCGRTDKGVSAFGQVIGIRVRSNRRNNRALTSTLEEDVAGNRDTKSLPRAETLEVAARTSKSEDKIADKGTSTLPSTSNSLSQESVFHPINDEIPYCQILNRLLPPDIRVLAWCPDLPLDFSARFSCKERRYKYFFTQPAFTPTVGNHSVTSTSREGGRREGWLDIEAMRQAAHKFVGLHDFRNFCKVDESKQIENFDRRIFHADIEELDSSQNPVGYVGKPGFQQYASPDAAAGGHFLNDSVKPQASTPTIYAFTLHGSAFLWHQVRHMIAILFLVGQGLEMPSLVDELLNVGNNPCKPHYEMADDAPLVLWDCIFPQEESGSRDDALEWVYVGDYVGNEEGIVRAGGSKGGGKYGMGGVVDDMWRVWRRRKMDEILAGTLLDLIVGQGRINQEDIVEGRMRNANRTGSQKVFQGDNGYKLRGKYIPVMERPKMETVEAINARYVKKKGFDNSEVLDDQRLNGNA